MAQVPSNLIPVRVTQLMTDPAPSADGIMMYVRNGVNYNVRVGDLLAVGATLPWSNITGTPTTLAGYGIGDGVSTSGSYANPSWLTSLDWNKLTNVPTFVSSVFGRTGAVTAATGDYSLEKITVAAARKIGSPVVAADQQGINDLSWSSGTVDGFELTDNLDGTVTVSAGTAVLRQTASIYAPMSTCAMAGATLSLVDQALNLVYADYNAGAPVVANSTSESVVNGLEKAICHAVYRNGTTLHHLDLRGQNVDTSQRIRTLFLSFSRFIHASGGTVLAGNGLAVTVTAGLFFVMITPLPHSAFDTTVAGTANENTFTLWYRDGVGGWVETINQKTVNSATYDNNTGTPVTLDNNKYGVTWFYMMHDSPSELHAVMGEVQYNSLAEAQTATQPSSVPGILAALGSLIGVVIYQKSAVTFADVRSAFLQAFVSSSPTNHNALAGLQGGSLNEYYHLTLAEHTGSGTGVFARVDGPTFTGAVGGIAGGAF